MKTPAIVRRMDLTLRLNFLFFLDVLNIIPRNNSKFLSK